MSSNEDELPDEQASDDSRLRDRATSQLQRRRQQAREGSTRLRERATSLFQQRKRQMQRAEERIEARTDQFADLLDLDPSRIEPRQLDDRGEEIGFVPDPAGRDLLGERFADDRPFVESDDALVRADPREGVEVLTDPDDRPEIQQRARQELAEEDQFARAGDFEIGVGPGGVTQADFTPAGQRARASREIAAETALTDVDPMRDIQASDGAFQLTQQGQRRLSARRFEQQLDVFGEGELDPSTDLRETGNGFGLARDEARQAAAADLDRQVGSVDIGPSDIELEATGSGGFEAIFEEEVRR